MNHTQKALMSLVLLAFVACPPLMVKFIPDSHLTIKLREYKNFGFEWLMPKGGPRYTAVLAEVYEDKDTDRASMIQSRVRVDLQANDAVATKASRSRVESLTGNVMEFVNGVVTANETDDITTTTTVAVAPPYSWHRRRSTSTPRRRRSQAPPIEWEDGVSSNETDDTTTSSRFLAPTPAPTRAPPATTRAPPPLPPGFTVRSGRCVASGSCVTSPNFPNRYNNYERCSFKTGSSGTIKVIHYDVETHWDYLTLDYTPYKYGLPRSIPITGIPRKFQWSSDGSVTRSGWKMCIEPSNGKIELQEEEKEESISAEGQDVELDAADLALLPPDERQHAIEKYRRHKLGEDKEE